MVHSARPMDPCPIPKRTGGMCHAWWFAVALLACATASEAASIPTIPFTLTTPATTSGGIFSKNGKLVKNVWCNEQMSAGSYVKHWDGTDDDFHLVPDGDYDLDIVRSNADYQWEGVIGNTSAESSGPTVHRSFLPMTCMAFAGNKGYYTTAYNEGSTSAYSFLISDPQRKVGVYPYRGGGQNTEFVCTDGETVYWGGDNGGGTYYVVATTVVDRVANPTWENHNEVIFANGVSTIQGYHSAIALSSASIGGLAANHEFIFVSRYSLGQIHVYDKTGLLVQTVAYPQVARLAADNSGHLYVTVGTTVRKHTINANGTLAPASLQIAGFSNAQAVAVSPDGGTVLVADGEPSHVVKAYGATTGNHLWDLGTPGGYSTSPRVTNTKFDLTSSYVAFQADGSFWVGDKTNYRAIHFAADHSYIDYLMWIPSSYLSFVDTNNPSRVFSNHLEFATDYSKPLRPDNGSWYLVRNYAKFIPAGNALQHAMTLSNGRTYGLMTNFAAGRAWKVVELLNDAPPRDCNNIITFGIDSSQLYPDGSMRDIYSFEGVPLQWRTSPLIGFDGAGNPQWGPHVVLASTPPITADDPRISGIGGTLRAGERTSSDVMVVFNAAVPDSNGTDKWHLGGVRVGETDWLFKTARNTYKNYNGFYPTDGSFDIGNQVNAYGGSVALVSGRNIYWGYHGEFWKSGQVNKWQHVLDNGMTIGQFGAYGGSDAPAGMAGNSFSAVVARVNGNDYLFHNDESYHAGVHRWKISNLGSIVETKSNIVLTTTSPGLSRERFSGSGLDNFGLAGRDVSASVSAIPVTGSARWTGYIRPQFSESYNLHVQASGGIKLWVDGTRIINIWPGGPGGEVTGTVRLDAGLGYAVRLESNGGPVTLSWSSPSQAKQVIPTSRLFTGFDPPAPGPAVDLMAMLPFDTSLEADLYGWKRDPAIDSADHNSWVVKNSNEHLQTESPDIRLRFAISENDGPQIHTVTRSLGTNSGLTSWAIEGSLHFQNAFPNEGNGGTFVEVLDANDRILARFWHQITFGGTNPRTVYGNNQIIYFADGLPSLSILWNPNPLKIEANADGVTFSYAGLPPVTTPLYDSAGDWRAPKSLRLYCQGSKYEREIHLISMNFSKTTTNAPPVVDAGPQRSITLPTSSVTLVGSAVDSDGTVSSYLWSQVSGGPASIASPASASTSVTGLAIGIHVFRLAATDNRGASGSATVQVTVSAANAAPVVSVGPAKSVTLPIASVILSGSATDSDGTIVTYRWTQVSGPAATIATPTSTTTAVTGLTPGVHLFRLTATDDHGATGASDVTVTVNAQGAPLVSSDDSGATSDAGGTRSCGIGSGVVALVLGAWAMCFRFIGVGIGRSDRSRRRTRSAPGGPRP